ncbi:uncharacterized protein UTRI_00460 [Ustilago trichophora]|uniref:Zinc finger PHD-type domain-containing protein n=1 Tax=Ustilago trichophora TaxID=86804 RepID=A0A5C3DRC2_9BASI|nr:uncharacterized protein UTRI_00460 [Ustilago trichophora]
MAGKVTRSGAAEADPTTSAPPASDATELSSDNAGAALKTEEGEIPATDAEVTSTQAETAAESENAKPSTVAGQEDAASRDSSESDDKVVTSSPSKKSLSRSKKGGRSSRGKSTSSKRSSEEQEATKDDTVNASEAADPSSSTANANDGDVASEAKDINAASDSTEAEAQSTSAPDAEAATDPTSPATNGRDDAQAKSATTNKELAQLGLGSFGDGADEEVIGPRRSRRGPGASPDPKTRVPKTEPDADTTSLQDVASTDKTEANASDDVGANEAEVHSDTQPAEDSKTAAEASAAPEEAASEAAADAKAETEDDRDLAPNAEAAQDLNETNQHNGEIEEAEADYADADEQGDLDGEEGGDEGVTRCVCGSADENVGLMIQCETCKCWQHCVCMGMQVEEDCPDVYFCEQCRPELHIPLLRSLGLLPKSSKKGTGKGAKYSARELKEAKEAIAMLAQENARRTQAAEAAAAFNSRDRKGGANSRSDAAKEVPKSPKRRSTMNSRDSAYGGWEPIPPGLLADGEVWEGADDRKGGKKRKRGLPDDHMDNTADTPETGEITTDAAADASKRRRMSAGAGQDQDGDAEMDEDDLSGGAEHPASTSRDKSHKKKKGNNQYTVREASVTADSSASKPRHPNQYTYRNKDRNGAAVPNSQKMGSSSTSNLTSHSPSPSPSKGRAENARRAAARENASQIGTPAPGESLGTSSRGAHQTSTTQWGLPEHLTHLAYLLPNAGSRHGPYRSSGSATENGSANGGKKGSSSSSSVSNGGPSPPGGSSFPTPFQVLSSIESSTKVRFPSRRMTMGEMRKRVRNIGEYVTRSQIEAVEREKRMKLLGIVPPYMDELEEEVEAEAEAMHVDDKDTAAPATAESSTEQTANKESKKEPAPTASAQGKVEQLPLSMRLMEELTRELINFQRKFGIGPGSYGSLSSSHQSATVN